MTFKLGGRPSQQNESRPCHIGPMIHFWKIRICGWYPPAHYDTLKLKILYSACLDNGKPIERWGRKAYSLKPTPVGHGSVVTEG